MKRGTEHSESGIPIQEIGAYPHPGLGPRGRPEVLVSRRDFHRGDKADSNRNPLTRVNKSLEDSHHTYGYGMATGRYEIGLRESGSGLKQQT